MIDKHSMTDAWALIDILGWVKEHSNDLSVISLTPELHIKSGEVIGADFLLLLGAALRDNTSVTNLDLSDCQISDISDLTKGLCHNSTLKTLDLSENQISDINILSEARHHNSTLQKASLSYNQIAGINGLAEALRHNSTLKELNLKYNQISESGKEAFRA